MGNGCSDQREMTQKSLTIRQDSFPQTKQHDLAQMSCFIPSSQLTQAETPHALLPSPSRQSISFENVITSKVRVPSEESQFQKQFSQIVENNTTIKSKSKKPIDNQNQQKLKDKKSKQQSHEIIPKHHSSSPKKERKQQISPQKNINQSQKNQNSTIRNKSTSLQKKNVNQTNEIEIISRRKYSDLPQKSENTQSKRKISNTVDDRNVHVSWDSISKVKSFTPSPILGKKASDNETITIKKKKVRFHDQNIIRYGFAN
ncbi:unnamed protein product [Paramecium pentaurelia]|uniref:Uncharacterized protein n=1 Tax=Paramecium pentaurelia TaxID=43138 RepID=A0A8S1X744_9CILI|nr:unnamed protein product [Paramecium pentaurelia]CAD8196807.1 unnamed protein product [Paramecium pentaurelia]